LKIRIYNDQKSVFMEQKERLIGLFDAQGKIEDIIKDTSGLTLLDSLAHSGNWIYSETDDYSIMFYGRLFNQDELKQRYNITASNDSELVLKVFIHDGKRGLGRTDGSFLCLIRYENHLHIIRDRHGTGPQLYYTAKEFCTVQADLNKLTTFSAVPDHRSLMAFLQYGYIAAPDTGLKGVKKLPGGYCMHYNGEVFEEKNLFPAEDFMAEPFRGTIEEAADEYERLHAQSIKRRIGSAGRVGILLSGGYDSGGNIFKLREIYNGEINGFSVGFQNNPWTEVPLAEILASRYGASFESYIIDGNELSELPSVVKQMGDPFQEGGLMVNYCAMRMAARYDLPVILGGDANDQFFGTAVKELALKYFIDHFHMDKPFGLMQQLARTIRSDKLFRIHFHLEKIRHILKPDSFGFSYHGMEALIDRRYHAYLSAPLFNVERGSFNTFNELYVLRNYYMDIQQIINQVILFKASQMASLWNQNITFPYADLSIFNFLKSLPRTYKCKGTPKEIAQGKGVAKFLHKKYLNTKLPSEITSRKKQGGFAPLPLFFKDSQQMKSIHSFIRNSGMTEDFIKKAEVDNLFMEYKRFADNEDIWFWQRQVKAFQLFNLLVLAIWWELQITNKGSSSFII